MRSSMISGVLRVGRHQGMGDPQLQDEFDVYFARAAAAAAAASVFAAQSPIPSSASSYAAAADRCSPLDAVADYGRRESLPDIEISLLLDDDQDDQDEDQDEDFRPRSPVVVRASSCRYPHRKQRVKDRHRGSASACSLTASYSVGCDQAMETAAAAAVAAGRGAPDTASSASASASASAAVSSREDHRGSSCLRAPSPRQELRCHSAPHSRSSSWKRIRRPLSFRDLKEVQQLAAAAADDARAASTRVSLEEAIDAKLQELKLLQADDCYVVRQFTTSPKGAIVNRGDSIKRRASSTSTASGASKSPTASPVCRSSIVGSVSAPDMPSASASAADGSPSLPPVRGPSSSSRRDDHEEHGDKEPERKFHVLVLGAEGVGKTSLLQQFMTSEYMAAVQTSFDDECEKTLSVLLDGEETMLEFIESNSITAIQDAWPSQQPQPQQLQQLQQQSVVAIYVFVYSLTARESLKFVVDQLHRLRETQSPADVHSRPAIVVANKTDLVRTRQVSEEEGRAVSRVMNCSYWEVSTVLNHQLDELLVRIVTRLRRSRNASAAYGQTTRSLEEEEAEAEGEEEEDGGGQRCGSDSDDGCVKERSCVRSATDMIRNLFRKQKTVSKSCEYLL